MAKTTITIVANPESKTIYATPGNGNVFTAAPGDMVCWTCARPFTISFFEENASGATIHPAKVEAEKEFCVTIQEKDRHSQFKYIVQVGNLVLDPYIHVD
jgi:hypothetical protein